MPDRKTAGTSKKTGTLVTVPILGVGFFYTGTKSGKSYLNILILIVYGNPRWIGRSAGPPLLEKLFTLFRIRRPGRLPVYAAGGAALIGNAFN